MDTPVHASRRSDTTKANKAPFLLYGGKVQVFGQVHLYGRLKVLNLVCLSGGGQGGYGMPICYQVMISFCCKGWPVNRWAWGTFEFKYGKMCLLWVRECGLLADGYACCKWSTWESTGDKWRAKTICLTSVTGSSLSKVHLLYCLSRVREWKNVGLDTRQFNSCPAWELTSFELWRGVDRKNDLYQLGNCHPLSCIAGCWSRKNDLISLGIAILWAAWGVIDLSDELQPLTSVSVRNFTLKSEPESSYLVDPASSHMLVSKIKPCMSKYKQLCTVKLRMAH